MIQKKKTQTLLIVDDDPSSLNLLNDLFKDDYAVMAAKDGNKAVMIALSDRPPDLILLDVLMPGIDGYEVLEILNHHEDTRRIPVIFVTSRSNEEDEIKGLEMGAVDYISKPFVPVVVKGRVKAQLELKRHRDFLEWMLKKTNKEMRQMEQEYARLFMRL